MTLKDLLEKTDSELLTPDADLTREVTGCYIGDLLSWVMAHAGAGSAWITVQTHLNVIAVSTLLDLACVINPEGVEMEKVSLEKAMEKEVPVLRSAMTAYELAVKLHELGVS
ncbi:AraC family transcriptional regulator [Gehongia tenuis]|uniref:AraC family transcriptional regulator n=1 Tax=Gehongia tenuis TaxID=2763655 RepID=A0A926HQ00_9FIRM|nr:AraC family transcriptional regulator [Gehongia tenuis]MBC8530736.1 AraC family transcriptional regulator [Gehongia tenuis]